MHYYASMTTGANTSSVWHFRITFPTRICVATLTARLLILEMVYPYFFFSNLNLFIYFVRENGMFMSPPHVWQKYYREAERKKVETERVPVKQGWARLVNIVKEYVCVCVFNNKTITEKNDNNNFSYSLWFDGLFIIIIICIICRFSQTNSFQYFIGIRR